MFLHKPFVMHPEGDTAPAAPPVEAPVSSAPATPTETISTAKSDYEDHPTVSDSDLDIFEAPSKETTPKAPEAKPVEAPKTPAPKTEATPAPAPVATPAPVLSEVPKAPPFPVDKLPAEIPAAKPAETVAPTPTPSPVAEPVKTTQGQSREQWREQLMKAVEPNYAIPESDEAEMLTAPGKVLPRYAARLHADVFEAVFNGIMSVMPQVLQKWNKAVEESNQAKEIFFKAWPDLRPHEETVARMASVYKQAYPNVTQEDIIKEVGAAAMVRLGLQKASPSVSSSPAAPASPFKPGNSSGAVPPPPSVQKPNNPFTVLAEEFLQEDER